MTIRRFFKRLFQKGINCCIKLGKRVDESYPFVFLGLVSDSCSNIVNKDISFVVRPRTADEVTKIILDEKVTPRMAIIMQGPLVTWNNYTVETIKIYKKNMPDVEIIVSTWEGSDKDTIKSIRSLGGDVVISELPSHNGIGNINYQVKSTLAGLERAEMNGSEYVIKTRTDQRFLKKHMMQYLLSLIKMFPIDIQFEYLKQRERMVIGQGTYGGNMVVPYYLSDFYLFGKLCDVKRYFDYPLQSLDMSKEERIRNKQIDMKMMNMQEFQRKYAPEIILAENYVSCGGKVELEKSVREYWDFVKSNLICVTHAELQFCWPKYEKLKMENKIDYFYVPDDSEDRSLTYTWTFANWLNLYCGNYKYNEKLERYRFMSATLLDI